MTPMLEKIAAALEEAERQAAYSMELIRLVDGDHTYRLQIDGQRFDFTDSETDEWNAQERLFDKLREIKRPIAARAALRAMRDPDDVGLSRAAAALEREWIKTHPGQETPFPIGYNNVRAGHRAMIDAILAGETGR